MPQVKGTPTPPDEDDHVTELQDAVLGLLEDAGIDTETNDAIIKLLAAAEERKALSDAEDADYRRSQRQD